MHATPGHRHADVGFWTADLFRGRQPPSVPHCAAQFCDWHCSCGVVAEAHDDVIWLLHPLASDALYVPFGHTQLAYAVHAPSAADTCEAQCACKHSVQSALSDDAMQD